MISRQNDWRSFFQKSKQNWRILRFDSQDNLKIRLNHQKKLMTISQKKHIINVTLSSSLLTMLSWASERMKMWHLTFPEPDPFLLIARWTPSFVFTNLNPELWRSLSLMLPRSIKRPNLSPAQSLLHSSHCSPSQIF